MEKEKLLREIKDKFLENYYSHLRLVISYKDDYKEIIKLKKELRLLTKKHDDFYKRNNGFYNNVIEIFLIKDSSQATPFMAKYISVENEQDAKTVSDCILKVINTLYKKETYYTAEKRNELDYYIKEHSFNEYELNQEYYLRRKKPCIKDIFDTKLEAKRAIYREISGEVSKYEKKLRILKEKQKEIESEISKELKNE